MRAELASSIAEAYGAGAVLEPMVVVASGQQGQVWRLATSTGILAIKQLLIRQTERDAAADVAYQRAVLAAGSVPMPRPLLARSGAVVTEFDGQQVRAYAWVDLLPSSRTLDPGLVGATVAAVHRVPFAPARPRHWFYVEPVGATRWAELLAAARVRSAPFVDAFAAEIPHLLEFERLLEPPTTVQSCHRDLWSDNILATPSGGVCVVDWENCGLADPVQELPMVMVDFCWRDGPRVQQLYDGYLGAGGPGRLTGYRDFTMLIAQFGHFWELAVAAYTRPGATEEAQTRSLDRVAELVAEPLRRDQLDEILDLVGGRTP